MGCSSSKAQNASKPVEQTGPLTETEIEARISAPSETQNINIAGVSMRYAWVSQRGYYPDGKLINLIDISYQLENMFIKY